MNPSRLPAIALAACVLGLATCPFLYFVSGAPFEIVAPVQRTVLICGAVIAGMFLLGRFLRRPSVGHEHPSLWAAEGISWATLLYFVVVVSDMRLMSDRERVGSTCLFFLGMALLWLPIIALRRTALEHRLAGIPRTVSMGALVVLLAVSGFMVYLLFTLPPEFL